MFFLYGNPLDVIKTNRMVQSEFSKAAGDNLATELALLWERGAFRNGVFRGVVPVAIFNVASGITRKTTGTEIYADSRIGPGGFTIAKSVALMMNPIASALFNPLANLQTLRQIVQPGEVQPTYLQLARSLNPI